MNAEMTRFSFSLSERIKTSASLNLKRLFAFLLLLWGVNLTNAQSAKWIAKGDQAIAKNNYYKAKQCYEKAIPGGEEVAYYKLGVLLSEGPEDFRDEEMAALCFFQAASPMSIDKLKDMSDKNSQDAQMLLGYCYQKGVVVERNLSKAVELYKKAEKFNLVFLIDALQKQIDEGDKGKDPKEEKQMLEEYDKDPKFSDETIYHFSETMPEFPGGIEAFGQTLSNVVQYPKYAMRNRISGTVMVEFVVEKDGSVDNARIMASCFPLLDNEALRAMKHLPKWKPGTLEGKAVRCFFQVPITFRY